MNINEGLNQFLQKGEEVAYYLTKVNEGLDDLIASRRSGVTPVARVFVGENSYKVLVYGDSERFSPESIELAIQRTVTVARELPPPAENRRRVFYIGADEKNEAVYESIFDVGPVILSIMERRRPSNREEVRFEDSLENN